MKNLKKNKGIFSVTEKVFGMIFFLDENILLHVKFTVAFFVFSSWQCVFS
jgi:hypothetical protein